jgi:redox-sensitive bicupin YhaK (pirin superfamily)
VKGKLEINGQSLSGGDALLLDGESKLGFVNGEDAEVLVFDLAPA